MGAAGRAAYVHHGSRLSPSLRTLLPGVDIDVLGPPTIAQKGDVSLRQRPGTRTVTGTSPASGGSTRPRRVFATPDAAELLS